MRLVPREGGNFGVNRTKFWARNQKRKGKLKGYFKREKAKTRGRSEILSLKNQREEDLPKELNTRRGKGLTKNPHLKKGRPVPRAKKGTGSAMKKKEKDLKPERNKHRGETAQMRG